MPVLDARFGHVTLTAHDRRRMAAFELQVWSAAT